MTITQRVTLQPVVDKTKRVLIVGDVAAVAGVILSDPWEGSWGGSLFGTLAQTWGETWATRIAEVPSVDGNLDIDATKRVPHLTTLVGVNDIYADQDGAVYTDDTLSNLYQAGTSISEVRDTFTLRVGASPATDLTPRVDDSELSQSISIRVTIP